MIITNLKLGLDFADEWRLPLNLTTSMNKSKKTTVSLEKENYCISLDHGTAALVRER